MFQAEPHDEAISCKECELARKNINVHFSVERISSIDYLILKKLVIIKLLVIL
jgi:hypothetical protein